MMGPLPPSQDDRAIWDIWQSQYLLPLVTVADELGTFNLLTDAAMTTGELAAALSVDARALAIHLGALAGAGLIEKREDRWIALPAVRTWLAAQAEGYWGGFLLRFRETVPLHAQLLQTLRTGMRPEDRPLGAAEWERGTMDPEIAARIAHFMHAHSIAAAKCAAAQPVFGQVKHLMDIGCGSGVYSIELARAHPALRVSLVDLKEMCHEAAGFVERAGLTGRIDTVPLNMFEQDWPTGADAHFFANVFHDWSEETNRLLARKSFDALPPGGRIFLSEVLMDDDGAGPWPAASFSILMLMGTLGRQYSLPEFREMLESAGFRNVCAVRGGGSYYSLVSAVKP